MGNENTAGRVIEITMGKANPNNMNGVSRSVHCLSDNLQKDGVPVEVWGLTSTVDAPTPARPYRLKLFEVGWTFFLPPGLRRELRSLGPGDVLHFHGCLIPQYFALSRYAKAVGARWVVSPRGGLMRRALMRRSFIKRVYMKLFENTFLDEAQTIHVLCRQEGEQVGELIRHRRLLEIPNGVNYSDLQLEVQGGGHADNEVLTGVFVGRLDTEQKGLDILLDGFAQARRDGFDGRLVIIGDGADRPKLEAQAHSLGIADRVEFLGEKRGKEKLDLMRSGDFFVHTSRWEGMPNAVLEALALGRPVLISSETNMGDPVNRWEAGLELPENTAAAIAEGLRRMEAFRADGTLGRMSANAEKMIRTDFDWSRIAREFVKRAYGAADATA